MKVQIIYLDPHDDHVSARDKLGWAQAPRILIVWPNHARVLTRRLDLVLLQRKAQQQSAQIGVVSNDLEVLEQAKALTIPVFESIDHISDKGWRRRARSRPRRLKSIPRQSAELPSPKIKTVLSERVIRVRKIAYPLLTILALVSIFIMIATVVPRAEFILTPATRTKKVSFTLTLDPDLEDPQTGSGIPLYAAHVRLSDNLRIPTSGTIVVPADAAHGFVVFTNLTSEFLTIPTSTGLRATTQGDIRFVTLDAVDLSDEEGAQIGVEVEAVSDGPAGNLPSGVIDAVEGTLGLYVTVTNPESTFGGANEVRSAVRTSDRNSLELELSKRMIEEAMVGIASALNSDETLLENSLKITQSYESEFDRQVGEQADSISLKMDLEIEGFYYLQNDLQSLANNELNAALLPSEKSVPGLADIQVQSNANEALDGSYTMQIIARQEVFELVDENRIRDLVRFQSPETAISLLSKQLDLKTTPQILLMPSWLPRVPWLAMEISFRYEWEDW